MRTGFWIMFCMTFAGGIAFVVAMEVAFDGVHKQTEEVESSIQELIETLDETTEITNQTTERIRALTESIEEGNQ